MLLYIVIVVFFFSFFYKKKTIVSYALERFINKWGRFVSFLKKRTVEAIVIRTHTITNLNDYQLKLN